LIQHKYEDNNDFDNSNSSPINKSKSEKKHTRTAAKLKERKSNYKAKKKQKSKSPDNALNSSQETTQIVVTQSTPKVASQHLEQNTSSSITQKLKLMKKKAQKKQRNC